MKKYRFRKIITTAFILALTVGFIFAAAFHGVCRAEDTPELKLLKECLDNMVKVNNSVILYTTNVRSLPKGSFDPVNLLKVGYLPEIPSCPLKKEPYGVFVKSTTNMLSDTPIEVICPTHGNIPNLELLIKNNNSANTGTWIDPNLIFAIALGSLAAFMILRRMIG